MLFGASASAATPGNRVAGIGILGGTFDPIHYGHLRMADDVAVALHLAQVRLVPNGNPYHRAARADRADPADAGRYAPPTQRLQRLAMCRLAVEAFPRLAVDPREAMSESPSYTVDTLTSIRQEVGSTPLLLIVGVDTFVTFPGWSRWLQLFDLAHIVVVPRPGFGMPEPMPAALAGEYTARLIGDRTLLSKGVGRIYVQTVTPQAISATRIREMTRAHQPIESYTPHKVAEYIEAHNLYRTPIT